MGRDIAERLRELAVRLVRMSTGLPTGAAGRHVALQLVRSVTGGGANYEEARAAESRDDFVHKIGVAAKEVRETIYWLEFIQRPGWTRVDLTMAIREAGELVTGWESPLPVPATWLLGVGWLRHGGPIGFTEGPA